MLPFFVPFAVSLSLWECKYRRRFYFSKKLFLLFFDNFFSRFSWLSITIVVAAIGDFNLIRKSWKVVLKKWLVAITVQGCDATMLKGAAMPGP
jgi:hypothetical protein